MAEYTHTADHEIRKVTWLGAGVNLILTALKILIGMLGHSASLVADGVHSFSDMATDLAVLLGTHLGSKEPDIEHPYGHGRFETFATLFVAAVLLFVGAAMIREAALGIAYLHAGNKVDIPKGWLVLVAAVVSVIAKEILYWLTRRVAIKTHSTALYANAWHHRSDAFSSVVVLVGLVAVRFNYIYGDQVAAIVVGVMVILVGVKIVGGCLQEFMERSVDAETMKQIKQVIDSEGRVQSWHKLRTRTVAREIFIDLHILVDPELNITEAHAISDSLEAQMRSNLSRPVNITVHIEPDLPELRKAP